MGGDVSQGLPVGARDHENVARKYGAVVEDGQAVSILVHDGGRNAAGEDAAEGAGAFACGFTRW